MKTAKERDEIDMIRSSWLIGSKETIARKLGDLSERTPFGEVMAVSPVFEAEKQKRSLELLKEAAEGI
ncbi:hypothetical protein [Bhargavaea cecembensis]|uniref:hypothetical protein n=1 Tax=Bhargavaea cecembensis TaxID=394098 RepID=UPI0015CF4E72|nr:hypothetical protein [Bhargavaea cecembensis]